MTRIAELLIPDPTPTVENAEKILLPEAAKKFAEWKRDAEKRGITVPPDAAITFDANIGENGMGISSTLDNVVTTIRLPESSRLWTANTVLVDLILHDDAESKPYKGSLAALNAISALAAKSGLPMPMVYESEKDVAASLPSTDGMGRLYLKSGVLQDPEDVKGVAGHELGHLVMHDKDLRRMAQAIADSHNDTTGATQRARETAADLYAVKLGVGKQLRDFMLHTDYNVSPNDKTHPATAQRVAVIDAAIAAMNIAQLPVQEADHDAKTPKQAGAAEAAVAPHKER